MENQEANAAVSTSQPRTALSSHTPGPWRLRTEPRTPDYGHPYMRLDAGDGIGDVDGFGGFHLSGIVSVADARLIAAAPDAFEFAQAYDAYMSANFAGPESAVLHPTAAQIWKHCRAYLARATGGI